MTAELPALPLAALLESRIKKGEKESGWSVESDDFLVLPTADL